MTQAKYPHFLLKNRTETVDYTAPRNLRPERRAPRNREQHGESLKQDLHLAFRESLHERKFAPFPLEGANRGSYLEFESDFEQGAKLQVKSLSHKRQKIELLSVTKEMESGNVKACVFVPDESQSFWLDKIESYLYEETPSGNPRNRDLIESIDNIRKANLRQLWTDAPERYPDDEALPIWWEIWLLQGSNELELFRMFAERAGIILGRKVMSFVDRTVLQAFCSERRLKLFMGLSGGVAELRAASVPVSFFTELSTQEQYEWSQDLEERCISAGIEAPAVCILDTGVTRKHPLLRDSLLPTDMHAAYTLLTEDEPVLTADDDGHGTEMSGLALYGDLREQLASNEQLQLEHRLESVKILPNPERGNKRQNPPELYGAINIEAAQHVEIAAPERRRVFSMSITASQNLTEKPSSWSAALDMLAMGLDFQQGPDGNFLDVDRDFLRQRLFFVSAGNCREKRTTGFLAECDLDSVHDPAQAWNVLSVGAYTQMSDFESSGELVALSSRGELSPYSTTSVSWSRKESWPIKPDFVMEGGNMYVERDEYDGIEGHDDLSLLTTSHRPFEKLFETTWATSAATAQAARYAAILMARHPDFWPETIRGLLVHSCEWTVAMKAHFDEAEVQEARESLLRRYGFGVPNLNRASGNANNGFTLILQEEVVPFSWKSGKGKTKEMHFIELPWPDSELSALGEEQVKMKLTLSYFIEPNPSCRGWKERYSYASHGLRFEIKRPTESVERFKKRLNLRFREYSDVSREKGDGFWFFGSNVRDSGSLHADFWEGSAADLAECNLVGVYPVNGWWKYHKEHNDRAVRYSLIISLETENPGIDLYSKVKNQIVQDVEIENS